MTSWEGLSNGTLVRGFTAGEGAQDHADVRPKLETFQPILEDRTPEDEDDSPAAKADDEQEDVSRGHSAADASFSGASHVEGEEDDAMDDDDEDADSPAEDRVLGALLRLRYRPVQIHYMRAYVHWVQGKSTEPGALNLQDEPWESRVVRVRSELTARSVSRVHVSVAR